MANKADIFKYFTSALMNGIIKTLNPNDYPNIPLHVHSKYAGI